MGVLLEIQTPAMVPELVERLAAIGCVTRAVDDGAWYVVHPAAVDAAEEWAEVRFFLRAWQAGPGGVELTLRPEEMRRDPTRLR